MLNIVDYREIKTIKCFSINYNNCESLLLNLKILLIQVFILFFIATLLYCVATWKYFVMCYAVANFVAYFVAILRSGSILIKINTYLRISSDKLGKEVRVNWMGFLMESVGGSWNCPYLNAFKTQYITKCGSSWPPETQLYVDTICSVRYIQDNSSEG